MYRVEKRVQRVYYIFIPLGHDQAPVCLLFPCGFDYFGNEYPIVLVVD